MFAVAACSKTPQATTEKDNQVPEGNVEMVFRVENEWDGEATKTTEVTSVANVYWCSTTGGNAGGTTAESAEWNNGGSPYYSAVSAGYVHTGIYVNGNSPGTRNYYASNVNYNSSTLEISATNATDVLAARSFGTNTVSPSVNLQHVFARMGTLTMNAPAGYTIDGISWSIRGNGGTFGTSGTYNIRTGGWSACSGLMSNTAISSGSNLYVIPGNYIITCSYTLHKGGMSQNVTATAALTVQRGKVNNITATAIGGTIISTTFALSVASWGASHNVTEAS